MLVGEGVYVRNSVKAPEALYHISKAKPDAVILFGSYKPCADLIRGAKKSGMKNTVFCNVSVVGTEPLIKYLAEDGDGVIISQVVPSPYDDSLAAGSRLPGGHAFYRADGFQLHGSGRVSE